MFRLTPQTNRRAPFHTARVAALVAIAGSSASLACPIDSRIGTGTCTGSYTKDGAFVKSNNTASFSNVNVVGADSCTGHHHRDVPNPAMPNPSYIIWAAAGPDGYTGVFYGNSATGNWNYTYDYTVGCGPCPPGTPIDMSLSGNVSWLQYAAGVGAVKLTGSASATVTGTIAVAPFPGSPFTVGANPATVTADPAVGIATAGDVNEQNTPLGSHTTQPCPLGPQTIRIDLTVTASRTGGITSSTASFNSVSLDVTTACACPAQQGSDSGQQPTDNSYVPPENLPDPDYTPPLRHCSITPARNADALCALGEGRVMLAEGLAPDSSQQLAEQGPRVMRQLFDGATLLPDGPSMGLVSSIVRGTQPSGAFSDQSLVTAESLLWDPAAHNFLSSIQVLHVSPVPGLPGPTMDVPLSRPLVAPSALAFGNGTPRFGTALLAALPDSGEIASITPSGFVQTLPIGADLGSPSAMSFGQLSGPWQGSLVVADVGHRLPSGVLQQGTGRLLAIDGFGAPVQTVVEGLRTPVGVLMGPAQFFGGAPEEVAYVLSAGDIDQETGFLAPATGRLSAFNHLGQETVLIDHLDHPNKLVFRTGDELLVSTATQLISVRATPCPEPSCPCDWNASGSVNSQDFFDFLQSFFTQDADFNADGITNSQDFFDFLACFFSPPPGC